MYRILPLLLLPLVTGFTAVADEGDWSMWRGDAGRTGVATDAIPDELSLLWHRSLGVPEPAFVHQFRMCADAAYAPVAAGGLLFVPSNLRDEVLALDLDAGKTAWRFITGGPVRYAPVAASGRLYVASDDGNVYCLEAATGGVVWKKRAVPERLPRSRLLVNGRLCSRWPVRGGPVLWEGTLFFGAGIWPEEGVYVSAVNAETGDLLWRTDALSLQKGGMNDHNKLYDLGLPPQGYLAIVNGKLAVPSGRSLAIFLDPRTGEAEPYNSYYTKTNQPRGTWWLCGNGKYWIQGGNVLSTTPIDMDDLPPEEMDLETFAAYAGKSPEETLALLRRFSTPQSKGRSQKVFSGLNRVEIVDRGGKTIIKADLRNQKASGAFTPGHPEPNELFNYKNRPLLNADAFKLHDEIHYTEPVLSGDMLYASIMNDPAKYLVGRGETYVRYPSFDRIVARDMSTPRWTLDLNTYHLLRRLEFPIAWELATPHKVMIASGGSIIAGTLGEVVAVKPPAERGAKATISFRAKVDGAPVNALVSRGKLLVSTDVGKVYCFGAGAPTDQVDKPVQREVVYGKAYYPSFPEGYALVLGWGDGQIPERLLAEGRHQIVVIEPDAALADRVRSSLAERGRYGHWVQIVTADPADLMLSKYWANLVVSEDLSPFSRSLRDICATALDAVRPFTGKLRIPADGRFALAMTRTAAARPEFVSRTDGGYVEFHRTAPPEGYDEWTHEAAGPANTFASRDRLVKGPLGLLWLSGAIDRFYTPEFHFQHFRTAYPLVSNGRMFLIGGKYMNAVDIYTGSFLWQIEMPMTQRVQWRYQDSRVYSRPYERNYVTSPDMLYIVYEQEIHLVATADGSNRGVFAIPEELAAADDAVWTEVRLAGDRLCCVIGDTLACLDRTTGKVLWHRRSTRESTAYAIGGTAVYGVDYVAPPGVYTGETAPRKESLLFRLDLATGNERWSTSVEHATVPEQDPKQKRPWLLPIAPGVIYNAKHQKIIVVVNRKTYYAFNAADGAKAWEHMGSYGRGTGSLHLAPMPLVADDIVFGATGDYANSAAVLDVATGKVLDTGGWVPFKRGCSRVIGNCNLLTYRNAATEIFDYGRKTRINFNSVRAGCTANFLPADGILNAPSFGQGCVCNYPTFASLAMVHLPELDNIRPEIVRASEKERSVIASPEEPSLPATNATAVDVNAFTAVGGTLEAVPGGCVFSTTGAGAGFAVRKATQPLQRGEFSFTFRRATPKNVTGRHGNSFFVFGTSDAPDDLIHVMLYYGGRSSIMISGKYVDALDQKIEFPRQMPLKATVRVDLPAREIAVTVAGKTASTKITGSIPAITNYGYGGSNSDTLFSEISVH